MIVFRIIPAVVLVLFLILCSPGLSWSEQEQDLPVLNEEDKEIIAMQELLKMMELLETLDLLVMIDEEKEGTKR